MEALHAFWGDSAERCGFVLEDNSVIEVPNHAEMPEAHFEIAEADFSEYEPRIKATWHTHVDGAANLSVDDYYAFLSKPDLLHYVISQFRVVCFSVVDDYVLIKSVEKYD